MAYIMALSQHFQAC